MSRFRAFALLWLALVSSLFGLILLADALSMPRGMGGEACLLPGGLSGSGDAGHMLVAALGLLHFLVIPGWLLLGLAELPRGARLALSCGVWIAVWIGLQTLFHLIGVELNRWTVGVAIAVVDMLLLAMIWRRKKSFESLSPRAEDVTALVTGLLFILLLGTGKLVHQNLSGDGVEAYSFGASLLRGPLPTWDLENGTWGFYPSFFSFAYPLQLSMLFIGPCEAAARLPIFVFGLCLASLLVSIARSTSGRLAAVLGTLLLVTTSGWNYSYDPYFADLAEPTCTDLFFALCFLGAVWGWENGRRWVFFVFGFLAACAQPAGAPFLILLLGLVFVLDPEHRRSTILSLMAFLVFLGAMALLASWLNPLAPNKFSGMVFLTYHTRELLTHMGIRQLAAQVWALLVQSGGAPVLFAACLFRMPKSGIRRAVLLTLVLYAAAVLLSPRRHPHYLTPVVAMGFYVLPRPLPRRMAMVWLIVMAFLLVLVFPRPITEPDQRTREFGAATVMVFPTEREAVDNADLLYSVLTIPPWRDEAHWGPGKHAWVLYGRRFSSLPNEPPEGTHLLFSSDPVAWSGFSLVTDNGTSFLYERPPGWLQEQGKTGPCTTCWAPALKIPHALWDPLSRWRS